MKKRNSFVVRASSASKVFLVMSLSVSLLFASCVRNTIEDVIPDEIKGLTVPVDFNWSSVASAQLTVIPSDTYQGSYYYLIEVFDANPVLDTAAVLLAQGVATKDQYFETNLTLPSAIERVYVCQSDPLKLKTVQSVAIDSGGLVCDFNNVLVPDNLSEGRENVYMRSAAQIQENETPGNAFRLTSNLSDGLPLSANTAYLIPTGVTYTGKITFSSGSSLYIEGALTVTGTNTPILASNTKLVIQSGGTMSAGSSSNLQSHDCDFFNYGSMAFDAMALSSTSTVYNYGTFTADGQLSTTDDGNTVINDGIMSLGNFNLVNGSFNNIGTLTVVGTLTTNGAIVTNSGSLTAEGVSTTNTIYHVNCGFFVNGTLTDHSGTKFYLKEGTILKADGLVGAGTKVYMESASMLEVETVIFNGQSSYISGEGSAYALTRFNEVNAGDGEYKCIYYSGHVEVECSNHYQGKNKWNPFYVVDDAVRWAETGKATTTIVSGNCNSVGNVVVPPETVPSNPIFPIEVPTSSVYSFIMEDNWPSLADYDMNDLVINLSISYKQNNKNMVTNMTINSVLRAVGAKKGIAAAVQLDEVLPSNIKRINYGTTNTLTGKVFPRDNTGYESGQTKVVIPFFDDAHNVLNPGSAANFMINTYNDSPSFKTKSNSVSIDFQSAVDPATISIMKLNFFIVPEGKEGDAIRTEIHLSGFAPTDKVDGTKFGKYYDNSVNGAWYTTPGNLVWGLLIPTDFKYAAERISILEVYPEFSGWCTSGGVNNKNWYQNPTTESGFLYNK